MGILKLYAIYTPFVTEYIYQGFFRAREKELSIHQTNWSAETPEQLYIDFGEHIKQEISEVRKYKTENQMSMKDSIPELRINTPEEFREFYEKTEMDLKACTSADTIIFQS